MTFRMTTHPSVECVSFLSLVHYIARVWGHY